MLVEKFVGVITIISEMEFEGELLQALDTVESDVMNTYEEAMEYIQKNYKKYGEEFHHAQVKKVFVKA